jgi:broad specificity phosphatase PhoE
MLWSLKKIVRMRTIETGNAVRGRLEAASIRQKMRLTVVRHGQTKWNLEHRTQGHQDSPLTALGVTQADRVGQALADIRFDSAFSSDLERALDTAKHIMAANFCGFHIQPDKRLRELNYGDWEGITHAEITSNFSKEYHTYRNHSDSFRAPNGESFKEMRSRFIQFLSEMMNSPTGNHLIVSHSGLIQILILVLTEKSLSELFHSPSILPASISIADLENGKWNLIQVGNVDHLSISDGDQE